MPQLWFGVASLFLLTVLVAGSSRAEGASGGAVRWMLLPGGGSGRPQVAILEGLQPRKAADPESVSFLLWTRDNPTSAERLRLATGCSPLNHFRRFRPERPTVLLIHGYGDSAGTSYMYPVLRDAFLETGDYNVLAVDWAELAATPWYATAAANTAVAAQRVAALLGQLSRRGADLRRFHVLGFSLGSHVAGLAARQATEQDHGRVGRITGLDPAQVLFTMADASQRLDRSHARRVDVIHTSGGYLAFSRPLGHRDFFPNGGAWPQPGCTLDYSGVCSHRRAYYYYAEALRRPEAFPARPCASWDAFREGSCAAAAPLPLTALAADDADDADDGDEEDQGEGAFYFLDTNPQPPFGHPPLPPPPPPPEYPNAAGPFGQLHPVFGD